MQQREVRGGGGYHKNGEEKEAERRSDLEVGCELTVCVLLKFTCCDPNPQRPCY